jgi:hypothetical protein
MRRRVCLTNVDVRCAHGLTNDERWSIIGAASHLCVKTPSADGPGRGRASSIAGNHHIVRPAGRTRTVSANKRNLSCLSTVGSTRDYYNDAPLRCTTWVRGRNVITSSCGAMPRRSRMEYSWPRVSGASHRSEARGMATAGAEGRTLSQNAAHSGTASKTGVPPGPWRYLARGITSLCRRSEQAGGRREQRADRCFTRKRHMGRMPRWRLSLADGPWRVRECPVSTQRGLPLTYPWPATAITCRTTCGGRGAPVTH